MTPSKFDPLKFGEISLGERGSSHEEPDLAKGDALFQDSGSFGEPKGGPALDNLPRQPASPHRNPLPPVDTPQEQESQRSDRTEAEILTGSPTTRAEQPSRREPLPSRRDHAAYSRMPMPDPPASRVVPGIVLGLGLGTAGYLGVVAHHYPMAIFLALISLVAAPLARLIFQGAIE